MKNLLLLLLFVPLFAFGEQYTPDNPVNELKEVQLFKTFILSPEINHDMHKEFWNIFNKKYKDKEQRERFFGLQKDEFEEMFLAANIGMKLFYNDALISLKNGKPYMSKERLAWYDSDLVKKAEVQPKSGEIKPYNVKNGHSEMMEKISKKIPIYIAQSKTEILFTKEIINDIILNLDNAITKVKERMNIIYDENYFIIKNSN